MSGRVRSNSSCSGGGGSCIKSGIGNINGNGTHIARGSTTSPNSTRHIQCFHNKNNNSSPFIATTTPLANKTPVQLLQLQNLAEDKHESSPNKVVEGLLTTTTGITDTITSSKRWNNSQPPPVLESVQKSGLDMAGDIRIVDSKRTRRHWTLRDRSNMSVHFLKANLAEEGCQDSQLDVAKKLLQDSRDPELLDSAQKENSRLAIYWLVKSSEQGNVAATKLLKECLDSGHGISAQNLPDVMTCINTPTNEKLTYKAARLLYLKLNNGEKFITTTQLLSRIDQTKNKKIVQFAEEENESESNQDSLNSTFTGEEDELGDLLNSTADVKLNETFTYQRPRTSRSQAPAPAAPLDDNDDEDVDSNKAETPQINYNQEGVKLTLEDLLKCASNFNAGESPRPSINRNHKDMRRQDWKFGSHFNAFCFQLLLLCAITQAITMTNCVLLGATFVSLWASFNLLRWKKIHSNFKDWSKAFGSISHDNQVWSDEGAEERLIYNGLLPYIGGLVLSTVVFFTMDGLDGLKLVIGILVSFSLLYGLSSSGGSTHRRFLSFKLIGFLIIINLPMIVSLCVEYLDLKDLDVDKLLSSFEFFTPLMNSLKNVDGGIGSCLYFLKDHFLLTIQIMALIPLLFGTSRKNFLQRTLPQLLSALWITKTLAIIFHQFQQHDDALVPIKELLIATIVIVLIVLIQSQLDYNKMLLSLCLVLIGSSVFITLIYSPSPVDEGSSPMQIAISNLQRLFNSNSNHMQNIQHLPLLEWDAYDSSCHRKAWKTRNLSPAFTQLSCFAKYGKTPTAVRWRGKISLVKIREMTPSKRLFSLGEEDHNLTFDIIVNLIMSEANVGEGGAANSASSWQQYIPGSSEYHAAAATEPPSPALVLVSTLQILGDKQKTINFVVGLQAGDKIEFHGILSPAAVGSLRPEVENVQSIRCLDCAAFEGMPQEEFFIHPGNSKPLTKLTVSNNQESDKNTDHINQSWQSWLYQVKQFITKLIDVVKTNIIFS